MNFDQWRDVHELALALGANYRARTACSRQLCQHTDLAHNLTLLVPAKSDPADALDKTAIRVSRSEH